MIGPELIALLPLVIEYAELIEFACSYKTFDVEEYCLDYCETTQEMQRVKDEMMMFESRKLVPVLQYIKYLVDTMRKNKIVWGVGRGSSLASFVLFLLGINKVNPLLHNLDIHEFLR